MGDIPLYDEFGGTNGTSVGTVDGVEGGVRLGVVGSIEVRCGLALSTGDGLLEGNIVNAV